MLDSGTTNHMTGSTEMLVDIQPNFSNTCVSYGDGSNPKVLGLGKVVVSPHTTIKDVMLVETFSYNLLSVA